MLSSEQRPLNATSSLQMLIWLSLPVKFLLLCLDFLIGALEEQRGDGELSGIEAFQSSHVKLFQSIHQSSQKRVHFRF